MKKAALIFLFFFASIFGLAVRMSAQSSNAEPDLQPAAAPKAIPTLAPIYQIYLPVVSNRTDSPTSESTFPLLADGQLVDGPNVGDFDIAQYLARHESPLLPYSSLFSDKASYYSINPRVLLTLIELLYPNSIAPHRNTVTASGSLPDAAKLDSLVEDLLLQLTEHFYGQLYGRNLAVEDAVAYKMPNTLRLRNGESIPFEASNNTASDALQITLAQHIAAEQWKDLARGEQSDSFVATYRRLFPESDPLDNSNQIRPPVAPPDDLVQASAATIPFLKLPFAAGDTWRISGGPHAFNGCSDNAFSAIDFAPMGYSGCSDPIAEDRWITAPADATVSRVSCGGCNVALTMGNGWGTRFYHVANPAVSVGDEVVSDQPIGNPSCAPVGIACGACTGSNTGVHQHVDLLYNGAFVAIEGAKFEEYTVRGEACYQGYLEKAGTKYYPPARITSMPDTVAPTATITMSGEIGHNNWYQRPLTLTISGIDDRSEIGLIRYQLQNQTNINDGEWNEFSGSSVTVTVNEDGVYTFTAKVSDLAGNVSITETLAFWVDGTPPQNPVVVETGCNSQSRQSQNSCNTPNFEWAIAKDGASGVAGYELVWSHSEISATTAIYTTTTNFVPGTAREGQSVLNLRTVDLAGNWSDWEEAFFFGYDTTAPIGSITINRGETIAHSALVSITTIVSDSGKIGDLRLKNGEREWSEWQPVQPALNWQLRGDYGETIPVAAQFRDAAGNLSEVVTDTIVLNTRVAQATSSRYQLIRSTVSTTNKQSISSRFALKGSAGQTSPIAVGQSAHYRLSAGYWRADLPADILPAPIHTRPPTTTDPNAVCILSIEYGALFTGKTQVSIQLDVTGAESMNISASPLMNRKAMDPYTTTVSIQLPAPPNQISALTAYGFFGGKNGPLCNGEVISDTIIYDPLPPSLNLKLTTVNVENGNREIGTQEPDSVQILASDQANGSGVAEMQLSPQADFAGAQWQPFSELIPLPLDRWRTLYVRVRDNAGNLSRTVEIVNEANFEVFLPLVGR